MRFRTNFLELQKNISVYNGELERNSTSNFLLYIFSYLHYYCCFPCGYLSQD